MRSGGCSADQRQPSGSFAWLKPSPVRDTWRRMLPFIRTCLANPFWPPTWGNFPVQRPGTRLTAGGWPERSISSAVQKQLLHLLWNSAKILSSASTAWEGLGPQLHQLQTQKKKEKNVGRDLWRSANPNPVSKHSQLQRWMLPYPSTKRAVSHKESSIESNKFAEETGKAKAH